MSLRQVKWAVADGSLDGPANQVHVWLASLTRPGEELNRLWDVLSQEERDRATRLVRPKDREWFIASHGILRDILSRYLGTEPAFLFFEKEAQGKPKLAWAGERAADLRFNMSHSNGCAAYAVALNREVGIDLEYIRRAVDGAGLARRFFSQREYDTLAALSGESQARRFFEYWTCREAFLKALGTGLRFPLNELQVSLPIDGDEAEIRGPSTGIETGRCFLRRFVPLQDFVGALAVEGMNLPVKWWRWEPTNR